MVEVCWLVGWLVSRWGSSVGLISCDSLCMFVLECVLCYISSGRVSNVSSYSGCRKWNVCNVVIMLGVFCVGVCCVLLV